MPEISVILPAYNVADYLPRALDSLLGQTFRDFEALVVDDGSADRTGEICDEYARRDPRVRAIHQKNISSLWMGTTGPSRICWKKCTPWRRKPARSWW